MDVLDTAPEGAIRPRSVLLIEDSPVVQDLVQMILAQRGHRVQVAGDGATALAVLGVDDFDVVLTDFHLPDFTGLEVVRSFVDRYPDRPRPSFVAITGDVRGLLSDKVNCELFDRVVPKPLDIDVVCDLVEQPIAASAPAAVPAPVRTPSAVEDMEFAWFHWPQRAGPTAAPGLDGIDAVLLHEARDLPGLWQIRGVNTMPVFDLTGSLGGSADLDVSSPAIDDLSRIGQLIDLFHDRRAELHVDVLRSEDPADRLLARLYVAGGTITPRRSDRHNGLVAWNTIADPERIPTLLTKLAADGMVHQTFFDRVHICPSCASARVMVREECHACQSAHLEDESYLHHFSCAYQGPESDFQSGQDLVCPKCRRELSHFGRDYDRPGVMIRCRTCQTTSAEPVTAFVCARCDTRTPAEAMPVRDAMSADLTDAGRVFLRSGDSYLGTGRRTLRFGDFPLELVIALNRAAAAFNKDQTPFALGTVGYDNLDDLVKRVGARRAKDSRRLWLESLQQALGDGIVVARGVASDFFLMPGADPDGAATPLKRAQAHADAAIRDDLGARTQVFGPGDIAG